VISAVSRAFASGERVVGDLHGDLQYRNVIWQDGRIAAVFDWDRIRVRPYAEEVARTATVQFSHADGLDLRRVAAFGHWLPHHRSTRW
jgi:Ser/Thr protein kinase RdoA (MazF antagonist)